jgi:Rhodopirellula transposase DDE domain
LSIHGSYTLRDWRRASRQRAQLDQVMTVPPIARQPRRRRSPLRLRSRSCAAPKKKKELVGDFESACRDWRKQGDPEEVRVHDFLIKEIGRVVPYGIL